MDGKQEKTFGYETDGDLAIKDPLAKSSTTTQQTRTFLEGFDPMTPQEYEDYYNQALKPLQEALNNVSRTLDKL